MIYIYYDILYIDIDIDLNIIIWATNPEIIYFFQINLLVTSIYLSFVTISYSICFSSEAINLLGGQLSTSRLSIFQQIYIGNLCKC